MPLPKPNFARNDPFNANRRDCKPIFAAGVYDAKAVWSTLRVDMTTLRALPADLKFTTTANLKFTTPPKESKSTAKLPGFAAAGDCVGSYSARGQIVVDLIGTPFKVAGPRTGTVRTGGAR